MVYELQKTHDEEKSQLEIERAEELSSFRKDYEVRNQEFIKKFSEQENNMTESHKKEYKECMNKFNEIYPEKNPKLSPEILNLQRKLEEIVKKRVKYILIYSY